MSLLRCDPVRALSGSLSKLNFSCADEEPKSFIPAQSQASVSPQEAGSLGTSPCCGALLIPLSLFVRIPPVFTSSWPCYILNAIDSELGGYI